MVVSEVNEEPGRGSDASPLGSRLPLQGIRVLDLTHVIAGPLATHQLRMMGAEVIKVEKPRGGDSLRSLEARPDQGGLTPAFRALNPGKLSVAIDLKTENGRAAILELARRSHVFVENFRPGVAARLGLSAADIRKVRPTVVYCSISGWGQTGKLAHLPAYDHVVQAATGMMATQGAKGAPVKVGFPVVDVATGMSATTAILGALLRRAHGDATDIEIDVSMVDSAMLLMSSAVAQTRAEGSAPKRVGNRGFVGSPGADTFETSDGHVSIAANTMGQFRRMCALLGRPDLARAPFLPDGLPDDAFLSDMASPELEALLRAAIRRRTSRQFEAELIEAGIPASRVRDVKEFLDELYRLTPGIDVPGEPLALRSGFRVVPETPLEPLASPTLGHDTDAVLDRLKDAAKDGRKGAGGGSSASRASPRHRDGAARTAGRARPPAG